MKKLLIPMIVAAASLGVMAQADAASGYIHVEEVLSSTPAFVQAGKSVVSEQQKMQKQFEEQSKNMSDAEKQALGQKLNQQLAQKENEVMAPIQAKFRAAVEKAAKDKGVDMVINARDVIYGGIDLTDAVKANMKS